MTAPNNARTVLLAEDNDKLRELVSSLLRTFGFDVISAIDGLDAAQKAKAYGGPIELFLSDLEMPRLSGIELATTLQSERPAIKVILMSASVSDLALPDTRWAFLLKPFRVDTLKKAVDNVLSAGGTVTDTSSARGGTQ